MEISNPFNRFYHGVVLNQVLNAKDHHGSPITWIQFREWVDTKSGGALRFDKFIDYSDLNDLKQIFKLMNLNYPIDKEDKASTTKISSKDLSDHIGWVLKIMGENGIELDFVHEQWERVLEQAGIEKVPSIDVKEK